MKCPKCKSVSLTPTKLEEDLPVMGCRSCEGVVVSLLHYREWAERTALPLAEDMLELESVEKSDVKTAVTCPKCARLMMKYLIARDYDNRLDVCASCDEAWIDSGEWALLKSLELSKELPAIFTETWQKRIKKERFEKQRYERLEELVGEHDAKQAREVKEWLQYKEHKQSIIHYIKQD